MFKPIARLGGPLALLLVTGAPPIVAQQPGSGPGQPGFPPPGQQPPPALLLPPPPPPPYVVPAGTPLHELLPSAPRAREAMGPLLVDDLRWVPEVMFAQPPAKKLAPDAARQELAKQIARIYHLNNDRRDGFMEKLVATRHDLAGLPLTMGDDCRMSDERVRQFEIALNTVRGSQNAILDLLSLEVQNATGSGKKSAPGGKVVQAATSKTFQAVSADAFWERFLKTTADQDRADAKSKIDHEHTTLARIAALTQVLGPHSPEHRLGLVKYLGGVPHIEATRALARLAIFSAESDVRDAAIDALRVRREKDYTGILMDGFRYPWPAVAKRAAEALAKLDRQDLLTPLVDLLETPDPRLPVRKEIDGKELHVVRELVKLNHHRNCLLCHAPGTPRPDGPIAAAVLPDSHVPVGAIPVPGEPLPSMSQGYQPQPQDLVVRLDVTYLRQDFSMMLPVPDAHPWPTQQRFDFVVRTRVVGDGEAQLFRDKLAKSGAGAVTPYERAILHALRELTGRDTEPSASAWRKLLSARR